MATKIILFICYMIVPLTMLGFGVWMRCRPPKEINGVFGYRTRMSMKNDETWRFAHEKCGRIWTWTGLVLVILSVAVSVFLWINGVETMTKFATAFSMAQVLVLVLTIVPVERSLRRHFDENGKPKE